ncbi:MAG: transporter [Alphaproteobacteria bacterium]|jgi:MFS family permease|nr:transporter [Alphaproteobacteria bacterium]MDF3034599.1 transporter [Alphaproteobacteria bacterium]
MGLFSSLNREQKQAIGLLQVGTFLEYFDLMLYVHMAVLLNEIFFPKTDPHTASLLTAFALCSSLAFRPIGALIFGWIGDRIGRKPTIIITTTMMAISCIVMANLPTYAQIGITASWIVTICRIFQGMSSMGEIVGAQIYLTESIKRPARFPVVASIGIIEDLGTLAALGIAFFVLSFNMNWRYAFWAGAAIAIVGAIGRTRLRETPAFLEMKAKQLKKDVEQANIENDPDGPEAGAAFNVTWKESLNYKTLTSYFFISCGGPFSFYVVFFHFIPILEERFGYSSTDIVKHNFFLACAEFIVGTILMYLVYWIHPLRIQKIRTAIALLLLTLLPFLMMSVTSHVHLFLIQFLILMFALQPFPSNPIFFFHFPIYCRFRCATLLFSIARALMYVVTSFGTIYLVSFFGYFGIWFMALPIAIASLYGLKHFERLERQLKLYPNLSPISLWKS